MKIRQLLILSFLSVTSMYPMSEPLACGALVGAAALCGCLIKSVFSSTDSGYHVRYRPHASKQDYPPEWLKPKGNVHYQTEESLEKLLAQPPAAPQQSNLQ